MTIPEALDIAVQHHRAGRLAEAEALYRQILATQPNHADALHLLGVVAQQVGRPEVAMEWIRRAIVLNSKNHVAHHNLGEACRAAGRPEEAVAAYQRALELKSDFAEAQNSLGNALQELGRLDEAEAAFHRALELRPEFAEAHYNLGNGLREQDRPEEAMAAYHRALELQPACPEARNNLGNALKDRGKLDEAMAEYRRALELKPDYAEAHNNLGAAHQERGELDEAAGEYRRALEIKPDYPQACNNLGAALAGQGRFEEAIGVFRRALELQTDYPEAHNHLGSALRERGLFDEAVAEYRRALALKPGFPQAHNNLGNALKGLGRFDEAMTEYRRALELEPDFPEALNNLGVALKDAGELDEAAEAFRRALEIRPDHSWTHSNLIFALHFHADHGEAAIRAECERWNRRFSDPVQQFVRPHRKKTASAVRLRIGYVSPDFRDHVVGHFALPLFERHCREQFEILCYSGVTRPDEMTERLRALASGWRNTIGVSDVRLAELIREDGVDILVDLAMHTAGNRLPMFARQPAPVQMTWLAYPGGTGLHSIGYRLTDAYMDPPGELAAWSAEEPVRLPDCWCCYQPVGDYPEINELPAWSTEAVTFGSLNNFAKVNEGVLALWARVMGSVKGSRLLMFCPEGRARERVRAFLGAREIAAERVEFVGALPRWEYLGLYRRIDLALDPFPCNGMTTTCDALWMGAPVLTLPGKRPVSRAGLSLLSSVRLGDLAASSEEDYLRIAVELAGDLPCLAALRATLRERMLASPLMDAPRFARNVEAAYGKMWERWLTKTMDEG